jgi:hypothetical protein
MDASEAHWRAMDPPASPSRGDTPDAVARNVQQQQEAQLAFYAERHRQRLQGGESPASRVSQGRAAQQLADSDAAAVASGGGAGVRAVMPQYEERLLEEEADAAEGRADVAAAHYRMPDGRLVPEMSFEAFKARAAEWLQEQVAWEQRTKKNAAVLST